MVLKIMKKRLFNIFLAIFTGLISISYTTTQNALSGENKVHGEYFERVSPPELPNTASFCGEPVPLHDIEVLERLDNELISLTYWHSTMIKIFKRAGRWFPVIEQVLRENGMPDDLKYLVVVESMLTNAVSPAKAEGFWQFLKTTGQEFGLEVNDEVDERYDVYKAGVAATKYLKSAHKRFGSWSLAAAGYNAGVGGISNRMTDQNISNYYDLFLVEETARYVLRIVATKLIMENPEKYGFFMPEESLYKPYETRVVVVNGAIPSLTKFALDNGTTLKMLKTLNPWLKGSKLTNAKKKEYKILLPK